MAHARNTDPETSHQAAKSLSVASVTDTQRAILKLLKRRSMNDEQLFDAFFQGAENGSWKHASMSGVRSRRSELERLGWVKDVGITKTRFGRAAILWGVA